MSGNTFISNLVKQSIRTFKTTNYNSDRFKHNLHKLKQMMDNLTAEHVNFNPKYDTVDTWDKPGKAPMTYIHIYEDSDINVGIFILRPDMKLPLHDHPHMHGLLKVISGKVKIENFSIKPDLTVKQAPHMAGSVDRLELVAKRHKDIFADYTSECCVLKPLERNLHEIESLDGPCAFVDVLAPPYDAYIPEYGARKCSYFKKYEELEPDLYHLREISSPHWFWSDDAPYEGPDVKLEDFEDEGAN